MAESRGSPDRMQSAMLWGFFARSKKPQSANWNIPIISRATTYPVINPEEIHHLGRVTTN